MTKKITGNESVMPQIITDLESNGLNNTYSYGGLTIRQHFASEAQKAILSGFDINEKAWLDPEAVAIQSIIYADALIKELNKNPAAETGS